LDQKDEELHVNCMLYQIFFGYHHAALPVSQNKRELLNVSFLSMDSYLNQSYGMESHGGGGGGSRTTVW
uniref:Uncharacterized protein n=1 Tax=Terrapene triunguis TaxID=2587831 RepID=A0A674IG04_9SAUR